MRLKRYLMTIAFAAAAAAIAALAGATAGGTSGPWFSANVALQMYSFTLLAGVAVTLTVAFASMTRMARLDELVGSLDLRLAGLAPGSAWHPEGSVAGPAAAEEAGEENIQILLEEIRDSIADAGVLADPTGHDALVERSNGPLPPTVTKEALELLRSHRRGAAVARAQSVRSVVGPMALSILFVAIAGAMLPGSEAFASENFRLNTALLLFLGYGWVLLLAWAVLAMLGLAGRPSASDG